jgi:hypothetical protein
MNVASSGKLTATNFVGLRMGFSVYAGWLTSATILNTSIMLKAYGLSAADMGIDEARYGVAILIIAECVYVSAGYLYSNPLYSSIYLWVLVSIRAYQTGVDNIITTTEVLLVVHGCYIVGLTVWLVLDKINNAPNEKYGLFY